jgi:tryptophanyl-tRNA synthetase
MSLTDPTQKMAKSDENPDSYILLTDTPDQIRNKVKRATTDAEREVRYDPKAKPGVSNLMVILSLCTGRPLDRIGQAYDGYAQFKKDVAEAVIATLEPIQRRYRSPDLNAPGALEETLARGADHAKAVATSKLFEAQDKMGLIVPARMPAGVA